MPAYPARGATRIHQTCVETKQLQVDGQQATSYRVQCADVSPRGTEFSEYYTLRTPVEIRPADIDMDSLFASFRNKRARGARTGW